MGYDLGYKLCLKVSFLSLFPQSEIKEKFTYCAVFEHFFLPLSRVVCIGVLGL